MDSIRNHFAREPKQPSDAIICGLTRDNSDRDQG